MNKHKAKGFQIVMKKNWITDRQHASVDNMVVQLSHDI
jgi:hypothetical protein